jgi:hypothetical protein
LGRFLGVFARGSTGRRFRSCKGAPQDPQLSSWLSFPRKTSAAFVPQQQVAIFCATMLSSSLVVPHRYLGNPHKVLNFIPLNFVQMLHFLKPSPTNVKKLPFSASEERVHLIIGYTAFFLPIVLWAMTFADYACLPASISHFYYIPIAGDLFVGALIFIGMCMLFVYRADEPRQFMTLDVILTCIAGLAAVCVAIFPTLGSGCVLNGETLRPFFVKRAGRVGFGSKTA